MRCPSRRRGERAFARAGGQNAHMGEIRAPEPIQAKRAQLRFRATCATKLLIRANAAPNAQGHGKPAHTPNVSETARRMATRTKTRLE
eukprot:8373503-Pyramimonas_sp.AAC.1